MNMLRTGLKSLLLTCAAAATIGGWAASTPAWAESLQAATGTPETSEVKIQVNDQLIHFPDAQPYIDDKLLTQVPVRFVSEELGYQVQWIKEAGQIRVRIDGSDGTRMEMVTGNPVAKVNGKNITLPSAPKEENGRVYVPLRFISETSGIRVQWDPHNFIAILNEDGDYHAPAYYKPKMNLISTFTATAYSADPSENGGYGAVDYFGNPLQLGTVAVDPNVIPLGTLLYIEGYTYNGLPAGGMIARATDTGSSIRGNKLDIFIPGSKDSLKSFGFQEVKVYKLEQ